MASNARPQAISLDRVIRVADFRVALRSFLRQSDAQVRAAGLTPQRYLLLLTVMGAPDGSGRITVGEAAERLMVTRHAVSELATRAAAAGLLVRERGTDDGRVVCFRLTPEGERRLLDIIAKGDQSRAELAREIGVLLDVFAASHDGD